MLNRLLDNNHLSHERRKEMEEYFNKHKIAGFSNTHKSYDNDVFISLPSHNPDHYYNEQVYLYASQEHLSYEQAVNGVIHQYLTYSLIQNKDIEQGQLINLIDTMYKVKVEMKAYPKIYELCLIKAKRLDPGFENFNEVDKYMSMNINDLYDIWLSHK